MGKEEAVEKAIRFTDLEQGQHVRIVHSDPNVGYDVTGQVAKVSTVGSRVVVFTLDSEYHDTVGTSVTIGRPDAKISFYLIG